MGVLSSHVAPTLTSDDVTHSGGVQPVATGDSDLCLTGGHSLADNSHVAGLDLGSRLDVAALSHHVGAVVGRGAKEQVVDVAAGRRVAVMADQHASWDLSVVVRPEQASNRTDLRSSGGDHAVSLWVSSAQPKSASGPGRCAQTTPNPGQKRLALLAALESMQPPARVRGIASNTEPECFVFSVGMASGWSPHPAIFSPIARVAS